MAVVGFCSTCRKLVLDVLLQVPLLDPFCFLLRLGSTGQTVHFRSKSNEFHGWVEPVSDFMFLSTLGSSWNTGGGSRQNY